MMASRVMVRIELSILGYLSFYWMHWISFEEPCLEGWKRKGPKKSFSRLWPCSETCWLGALQSATFMSEACDSWLFPLCVSHSCPLQSLWLQWETVLTSEPTKGISPIETSVENLNLHRSPRSSSQSIWWLMIHLALHIKHLNTECPRQSLHP